MKKNKMEITRKEYTFPKGDLLSYFSTDLWMCVCGEYRRADEKCIHIEQDGKIIDNRKEKIL